MSVSRGAVLLGPGSNEIGYVRTRDGGGNSITSTNTGTKQALDVNIAGSAGAMASVAGSLTAAVGNTPGSAVTASTSAQVVASVANAGNVTFHLVGTAFVGTVIFEASVDGGLNYSPIYALREDGSGSETGTALSIASAFIRQYTAGLPGLAYFRVRCSAFTSGSLAVLMQPGPSLLEPNPSLAASSATIGAVARVDGFKATYIGSHAAAGGNFAGDQAVLRGSATKTIRVTRVDVALTIGGTPTSAGLVVQAIKRSGTYSGGTAGTAGTIGPYDSTSAASGAAMSTYTAAPTAPGQVAIPATWRVQAVVGSYFNSWQFGSIGQAVVLRGISEHLAINLNSAAIGTSPAAVWGVTYEWTEE